MLCFLLFVLCDTCSTSHIGMKGGRWLSFGPLIFKWHVTLQMSVTCRNQVKNNEAEGLLYDALLVVHGRLCLR